MFYWRMYLEQAKPFSPNPWPSPWIVPLEGVQFTPDLLPSDLSGINFYNQKIGEFQFRPGPVFTNILLADEINRATPRTQSSLLETMEERQVTVDGDTRLLERPFMVLATQNPVETQGTFPARGPIG